MQNFMSLAVLKTERQRRRLQVAVALRAQDDLASGGSAVNLGTGGSIGVSLAPSAAPNIGGTSGWPM